VNARLRRKRRREYLLALMVHFGVLGQPFGITRKGSCSYRKRCAVGVALRPKTNQDLDAIHFGIIQEALRWRCTVPSFESILDIAVLLGGLGDPNGTFLYRVQQAHDDSGLIASQYRTERAAQRADFFALLFELYHHPRLAFM
jgi:hypothetical protein